MTHEEALAHVDEIMMMEQFNGSYEQKLLTFAMCDYVRQRGATPSDAVIDTAFAGLLQTLSKAFEKLNEIQNTLAQQIVQSGRQP